MTDDADLPFASVIVPTWNRADLVATSVASLLAQDYPADRFEVLVVVDGSTDGTATVIRHLQDQVGPSGPALRVFGQPHRGPNAARNIGFSAARGDPICLVDDDVDVPPSWLRALVGGAVRNPGAGCLGGPIRLRLEGRAPRMCGDESLGEGELDLGDEEREVEIAWSGNMAIRRAALDLIGPFRDDLRLLGHTEAEWVRRLQAAGGRVVYVPDAWLWHRRTASELRVPRLMWRNFLRGRGQSINGARFGLSYGSRASVRRIRAEVLHAWRRRCAVGLIRAAQHAGRLLGNAEVRVRAAVSEEAASPEPPDRARTPTPGA
jgi:glycosyltransferase involved in cell wall biosynthesis